MPSRSTRKSRVPKNVAYHEGECCEVTFDGLGHWHKHLFEELGWMVLASHRGMNDKVMHYKTSLSRFKHACEHKLTHVTSPDHKQDILIMHHNIKALIEHVDKDFP
jgi:hypothetical protein